MAIMEAMAFFEVRAFRGTRQSSDYRRCDLPTASVDRMRQIAVRLRLTVLAGALRSLERGQADVAKESVRDFAQDVEALRLSGELLELDDELARLVEVANRCSRAPKRSWLTVRLHERR